MSDAFSYGYTKDDRIRRVLATVSGPMDAVRFVDEEIKIIDSLDNPWDYDWLIDITTCVGFVSFDELQRLGAHWKSLQLRPDRIVRSAIVTLNAMSVSRLPTIAILFPNHELRMFTDIETASAWLNG